MQISLLSIQDTVVKYAQIIAKISRVDVEVVDENLYRIAGTGIYAPLVNQDMSEEGYVYRHVLQTGKRQIIAMPGHDTLCLKCPKRNQCNEVFEISMPIKFENKIIGVIGMVSSSEEQKELLLADLQTYLDFLDQIAFFIVAKMQEYQKNIQKSALISTLNKTINHVEQGVLILDEANVLITLNETAKNQLNLQEDCIGRKIELEVTGDTLHNSQEYKILIDGKTSIVFGELQMIEGQNNGQYAEIFLFRNHKSMRSQIYTLTSMNDAMLMNQLLGSSEATQQLRVQIQKIAGSTSTVLITGESGTGKEMVASAIWRQSNRADKRFVTINCAAIPEQLLESELFGYVKGAFTGASPNGHIGKFELAHHGIIFLDEIGDMPLYLQAKLLRVLQERTITRIGSNQVIPVDIRIIAATNKDLEQLITEKKFREDLYYRLNVIPLSILPLRQRKEDIKDLIEYFLQRYVALFHKYFHHIEHEVMQKLMHYNWPGNVRELENTIEFMVNMMESDGIVNRSTLPKNIIKYRPEHVFVSNTIAPLRELERNAILKAIRLYGTDTQGKRKAAKSLGIGVATLYRKLDALSK